jgi:hypothetical protein
MLWAGGVVEHRAAAQPYGARAGGRPARQRTPAGRPGRVVDRYQGLRIGSHRAEDLVRLAGVGGLALLFAPRAMRRSLRLVRACDRRYGFLESCRAIEAVAWYTRSMTMLTARRPGAVLVSGDSNPEEVGFIAAARARGIPQVFVAHAYPTPFSPPLNFTLSILEGQQAVDARRLKGPITGAVLLAGMEGESARLDPRRIERANPVIGIFPPKAFSWKTLAAIVDDCRAHFHARQIVIRWHPSMLESPRLGHRIADRSRITEYPGSAPFHEVARQCDWVIAAENSNVHLPLLKLGIPTVAVKDSVCTRGAARICMDSSSTASCSRQSIPFAMCARTRLPRSSRIAGSLGSRSTTRRISFALAQSRTTYGARFRSCSPRHR